ncbi:acyl-CoA mutase large subunit family protein [Ramlibacter sp.]|uniref:acyl-CoA mutase large subunit family protein n=1 Tax=Ramlibacter sp. TaxID=1917967 RepID=UPI002B8587FC|nr:acyl-CoA mutase large subunit family protein [Ramlibacter sp.]HWI84137.1 acyl-CoA mutase large subunit family protein [Ramlibacter sp.]
MTKPIRGQLLASADVHADWQRDYAAAIGQDQEVVNRSGIAIKPLYTERDWDAGARAAQLGLPGQPPYTRGIYPTMHRGRTWTQRQLIGHGTPAEYNQRLREILAQGATAISPIPCNSVFRGYDMDESHIELLGTCGTVINTWQHMDEALAGVDLARTSCAQNDPSPFTLLAFMLAAARRRGTDWRQISGTSNQSDYLSHYVANHMFFRIALPGARRILGDHIAFCTEHVPRWNPMSVVGQHMQQAGANPAEAVAFTLATALQNAQDCIARGMDPDDFLPRFTFFFDISISLFEEVAKFRAARRIWSRLPRERLGAKDPRSWRFKFHGQTSGVDLTRQQPLNNIARVTVQAMAGILGGLQSLHTDAWDEALSVPSAEGARIAVATQNILREEAHLTDVIDPLGGSFYVEKLTDDMEAEILRVMKIVDDAGGMYRAVEAGLVQRMIGESARKFQQRIDDGRQTVVGVNAYQVDEDSDARPINPRPDRAAMQAFVASFQAYKAQRSQDAVRRALDALARAAADPADNVFARVVEAAEAGCTHGEICGTLRRELGFGHVQAIV